MLTKSENYHIFTAEGKTPEIAKAAWSALSEKERQAFQSKGRRAQRPQRLGLLMWIRRAEDNFILYPN